MNYLIETHTDDPNNFVKIETVERTWSSVLQDLMAI